MKFTSYLLKERINESTVDEGLLLMGSDVDESSGYKVVNRTEGPTSRRLAL